jgi:hypothetical protein
MKRMHSIVMILVFAAAAASVLICGSLHAQTVDEQAKLHYKQAMALFQEGNYKMALAEFNKSYELKPNWKLKLSIGICYFNMSRFLEARKELLGYLEEGGGEVPEDKSDQAKDLLAQISKLIAEIKVEANVDGAAIFIDDKEIGSTPMKAPYAVEAGLYRVRIEANGYKPYEKDVSLAGGDSKVLDVTLVKKTKEAGGGEGEGGKGGGSEGGEFGKGGKGGKKIGGIGIGAIVTGGLALGAWGGVVGLGVKVNDLKADYDNCADQACRDSTSSDGDKYKTALNFAMIPIAAVLTATSISLGIVEIVKQKKKKAEAAPSASIPFTFGVAQPANGPEGMMLTVSGRF